METLLLERTISKDSSIILASTILGSRHHFENGLKNGASEALGEAARGAEARQGLTSSAPSADTVWRLHHRSLPLEGGLRRHLFGLRRPQRTPGTGGCVSCAACATKARGLRGQGPAVAVGRELKHQSAHEAPVKHPEGLSSLKNLAKPLETLVFRPL